MKTIDSLVGDIEALFENGKDLADEALNNFTTRLGEELKEKFKEHGTKRKPYLRLSNVGKPLRQLWFELASGLEPEPLPPEAKFKFLYGNILEELLILLAIEAGHSITHLQEMVEIDDVKGHIDCLIDGVLVDVKSASSRSFAKFASGSLRGDDPFGYIGQLAGYSTALGGLDGAFLAVDKTLGKLTLLRLSKEELAEYDVRNKIVRAREAINETQPPSGLCYEPVPEGKSGNLKLPIGCSYCPWKHHCYKDSNEGAGLRVFAYSTGPVFLTHVGKTPKVQEI